MNNRKRKTILHNAQQHALHHGSDLLHALGCLECGLRGETLALLAQMEWTEETFMVAYFEWLLGGADRV